MTLRSVTIAPWSSPALFGGLVALAWVAVGCISPKDDYADFAARPLAEREASVADVQVSPCQEILSQVVSGSYYTSCLPKELSASFVFVTTQKVTVFEDGTTGTLEMSFTALKVGATSMTETTGPVNMLPKTTIDANCAYTLNIGTLTLPTEANTLGRDLTATDVVLRGMFQIVDRSCAELDGEVKLIELKLFGDGDICIFTRVAADGPVPEITDYTCDPKGLQPRMP